MERKVCSKNCPSSLRGTDTEGGPCLGHRPQTMDCIVNEIVAADLLAVATK